MPINRTSHSFDLNFPCDICGKQLHYKALISAGTDSYPDAGIERPIYVFAHAGKLICLSCMYRIEQAIPEITGTDAGNQANQFEAELV